MKYPRIIIDLQKIQENTRVAANLCSMHGISLMGVTKACLGSPEVARAMLTGGADRLGDSRIENILRLRTGGIDCHLTLLRLPMPSETGKVVELTDASLNSDLSVIKMLGRAAEEKGKIHEVMLIVDTGDGREGMQVDEVGSAAMEVAMIPGVILTGVGTNVACLTGRAPTPDNLKLLVSAWEAATRFSKGRTLGVSGGNSSAWDLLRGGLIPGEVNELRIGEAILLGKETVKGEKIPDMHGNAFVIEAEIIEALPAKSGHYVAAIGRQDIEAGSLTPVDMKWIIGKGSSDHLVLRLEEGSVSAGEIVRFVPGYDSLLRAMTSPFVAKVYS